MELRWDSVSVEVAGPDGKPQKILNSVSGVARPGELVALLGPSGAGKTTLLAALAGRVTVSSGKVTVDGVSKHKGASSSSTSRKMPKQSVAFITQEDTMLTQLTVFETLWYASAVRLPGHFSQKDRLARVQDVIKRLGLAKVAHTPVGTDMDRGLSGGERKRLNVAQELLTNPSVLLADEPTSGLDHVAALSLVGVFAELAAAGRTVVATVHQPSSRLFRRFTTCCVLGEGRLVYCGPASAIASYMESPPIGRPCPPHYNIADHVLEVIQSVDPASLESAWARAPKGRGGAYAVTMAEVGHDPLEQQAADVFAALRSPRSAAAADHKALDAAAAQAPALAEREAGGAPAMEREGVCSSAATPSGSNAMLEGQVDKLHRSSATTASAATRKAEAALESLEPASPAPPACMRSCGADPRWPTSWCQQFVALTSRALRTSKGSALTWHMCVQHLCTVTVASGVWWRLGSGAGAIQDKLGVLTFFVVYVGFISAFTALTTFPAERDVLRRERQSGAYRLSAYYLARCAADIPVSCVFPLLVCGTIYWTTGLRDDAGAFFAFLGNILLLAQVAQALGALISAAVLDFSRAIVVASVAMFSFMLTSGLYSTEVPPAFEWIKYVGFTTYGYSIAVFNEFPTESLFECESLNDGFAGLACPVTGSSIRDAVKPLFATTAPAVATLAGMYVMFRALGYVALRLNA